jgi:hypothetical protein
VPRRRVRLRSSSHRDISDMRATTYVRILREPRVSRSLAHADAPRLRCFGAQPRVSDDFGDLVPSFVTEPDPVDAELRGQRGP